MSEDIYAKPDLSKKGRFQTGEKKEEEDEEEESRKEGICDNTENGVIYYNCWTEKSTPKPLDSTTYDQQKNTSVSPSEDVYAKPDLSKKLRFQTSEKKEEEDEERRNTDIYSYLNNVVTVVDPSPLKTTLPRAAGVFLGLLCLVLLAAVIVLLVLWIQDKSTWNTQRNQLSVERDKLQAINDNLTTERDELQNQLETHYCPDDWIRFGKSCYLISKINQQIPKKTWTDSKKFCEDQAAHLVIISNEKEQRFVSSFNLRVWIGLTDEETEGVWKWVDGTEVTEKYWGINQPDNYEQDEDCVEIYHAVKKSPLETWNDNKCWSSLHFICEKILQ